MGQHKTYKCNNCGYSVLTSAGPDWGFVAVTDTYICKSCNKVFDVTVGKFGKVIKKRDIPKTVVRGLQDRPVNKETADRIAKKIKEGYKYINSNQDK